MIDFNYVVELSCDPGDSIWPFFRREAIDWLEKHAGVDPIDWSNIDVKFDSPVTLGFARAKDMRKFILWSSMHGVHCSEPEVVLVKLTRGWDYEEVHVNL